MSRPGFADAAYNTKLPCPTDFEQKKDNIRHLLGPSACFSYGFVPRCDRCRRSTIDISLPDILTCEGFDVRTISCSPIHDQGKTSSIGAAMIVFLFDRQRR
jgi:hypothetical protein